MRVLRAGALWACVVAVGCAAQRSSSPPPSSASSYRQPQAMPASAGREMPGVVEGNDDSTGSTEPQVDVPAATTQSAGGYATTPVRPSPAPPSVGPTSAPPQPGSTPRDEDLPQRNEQVARLERWLRAEAQRLTDTREQCRDVCMAAGNICTAAQEICRLTGDPSDARCARAQTACAEAGVTRDSRCPVCPSVR